MEYASIFVKFLLNMDENRNIMNNGKHSIMIIDDHPIIHDGLRFLFENDPELEIWGDAYGATEAMDMLEKGMPDLALIDLSMGDSDGTYLIQRIHAAYPRLKIMVYTMSEERLFAERTATAGAIGYVMKTTPPPELKECIRSVLAGNLCFAPDIQERIEKTRSRPDSTLQTLLDNLSNREMDVFRLLGEGLDSVAIGEKLNISRNTADTHRINIKNKLGQPNGKALERLAFEVFHKK